MASSRRTGTNESGYHGSGWTGTVDTFGDTGYGRDYTSLATWEADTDVDLVTLTRSAVLECYDDAASYTDTVVLSGAITDSSYFRIVRAASSARHLGVPGAGVVFASTSDATVLAISPENYASLYDLEVQHSINSASARYGVQVSGSAGCVLVGLLVTSTNAGAGVNAGVNVNNSANANLMLVNCIAYECESYGFHSRNATTNYNRFYNCTAVNNGTYGFEITSTPIWINCIGYNNTTADWEATGATGTTHNLSKDTSAPALGTYYHSKTLTFTDAANDIYTLSAADTDAIGYGTDLSGDGTFAFDDDIAFNTRS